MSEVESGQETEDGAGSTTTVGEGGKQCTVYNLMADTQQCIRIFRAASACGMSMIMLCAEVRPVQ